jgi:hypothetical protein
MPSKIIKITLRRKGEKPFKSEVEAEVFGGLAIYESWLPPGFTVGHVRTGRTIIENLSMEDAISLKDKLLALPIEWAGITNKSHLPKGSKVKLQYAELKAEYKLKMLEDDYEWTNYPPSLRVRQGI